MGLFSSKKKTIVGTTVARAVEDDMIPEPIKKGVLGSVIRGGDVVEHILGELNNGVSVKTDRMYSYAKNKYEYGLPIGSIFTNSQGEKEVLAVLRKLYGNGVSVEYSRLSSYNYLHMGWMTVQSTYGYNSEYNELVSLSASKKTRVYLDDIIIQTTEQQIKETLSEEVFDVYGMNPRTGYRPVNNIEDEFKPSKRYTSPSKVEALRATTKDRIRVEYSWRAIEKQKVSVPVFNDKGVQVNTEIVEVDVEVDKKDHAYLQLPELEDAMYFNVCYHLNKRTYFWLYKMGAGTHPTLDKLHDSPSTVMGEFYPHTYFRYAKTNPLDSPNSTWNKQGKKIAKIIGMDFDTVVEKIHENPDIKDVEQAMLVMAVSANSTNPTDVEYLYTFFSDLYKSLPPTVEEAPRTGKRFLFSGGSRINHVINFKDKRFEMALGFNKISREINFETIGPIGMYSGGYETTYITVPYIDEDTGEEKQSRQTLRRHTYRKQISEFLCEKLEIDYLRMTFHIYQGHNAVGDEDDDTLLVPLERRILKKMSVKNRNTLVTRSMHYVFNSRVVKKIKWYQRGVFQIIIKVAAIAIIIYSLGTQAPLMAALMAAGMYTALAIVIIEMLVIAIITNLAIKLAVKVLGPDLAIIAALIATAVRFSPLGNSIGNMPWAQNVLQASTGLIKGVSDYYQDALIGLQKEYESFAKEVEEATKLINETNKSLQSNPILSPLYIIGEAPNSYYGRSSYIGQHEYSPMETTKSYFDMALSLPTISDTIGDDSYEHDG